MDFIPVTCWEIDNILKDRLYDCVFLFTEGRECHLYKDKIKHYIEEETVSKDCHANPLVFRRTCFASSNEKKT